MAWLAGRFGLLPLLGAMLSSCAGGPPDALALTESGRPEVQAGPSSASDLDGAIRQAQLQRVAGNLDGAIRTLSQLVLAAPDDPRVIGEYGKALVAKGEPDDALAFLSQAIALQPNDWMLYSAQGVAYDQLGDYPAATAAYDRALALKPGEPSVLSNAGLSRLQAGDLAAAEQLLRSAVQHGAGNPRIGRNLALLETLKPAKAEEAAPVPSPVPVQAARIAPAMEAPASAPVTDVAQTPLPAPAKSGTTSLPGPLTGIAALAADPTVVMAPIPRDGAGGKPAEKPAPKAPASAPPQKLAEFDAPVKLRPAQ